MKPLSTILVLVVTALGAAVAQADVVTFANGDRLSGKVLGLASGKLRLKTEQCGTVEIDWKKIQSLESDQEFRIEFEGREATKGTLALKGGQVVIQETPVEPPLPVPPSSVSRLEAPGAKWFGSLTLSLKAEDGNNRSTDLFLAGEIVRDGEVDKLLAKGHVIYGTENGVLDDQAAFGRLQYNLNLSKEWYAFAGAEGQTDKFEDLTVRSVVSAGPGYIVAKESGFELWFDAGPAVIHEVLRDGTRETWFGARTAAHILVKLPLGLEVQDDLLFYPNFKESTNWQLHNEFALSTLLGSGWSLTFNIISDLDHEPVPGKKRLDDLYALGLRFKF